jgi:hypothetical protein
MFPYQGGFQGRFMPFGARPMAAPQMGLNQQPGGVPAQPSAAGMFGLNRGIPTGGGVPGGGMSSSPLLAGTGGEGFFPAAPMGLGSPPPQPGPTAAGAVPFQAPPAIPTAPMAAAPGNPGGFGLNQQQPGGGLASLLMRMRGMSPAVPPISG